MIGRQRELLSAQEGFTRAFSGLGCAFAVAGEPGIGKTRLATELSALAQQRGLKPYWGRAWESGGAPSYWPWRQLLEALDPRAASAEGPLELLWSKRDAGGFSASDPKQARFELFDAVVRVLREQSAQRPLLLLLDDLHAADVATVELADYAIGALASAPIVWAVTWRDAEAERLHVRDAIARLSRRCQVLSLPRLSREQISQLVHSVLPGREAELTESLLRATSGNPLFLHETIRAVADGRAAPEGAQLPVTQGVALVVRDRVATLSPEAQALAEVAAVLGREVTLELLAAASGSTPATVRALASEIGATGLWSANGPERWLFSHALVRDALFSGLAAARQMALQGRTARALDALVSAGRSELVLSRATHALDAFTELEAPEVARWVIAAANQARAQRAYEEAVSLLERAGRELSLAPADRAELLLALGWALGDLGDAERLEKTFDEAIAVARALGSAPLFARAVLGRGSRYRIAMVRNDLLPLIDEALGRLGEGEVVLKALLWGRKASALTPARLPKEALGLARRAIEAVKGSADRRAVAEVAVAAGSALGDFAPPAERIVINTGLVEAARGFSDRALELRGLSRLVVDHLESGDVTRAEGVLLERDALASSLGHARFRWMTPLFRSMRAMIEGRFDDCNQSIDEAIRLSALAEDDNAVRCTYVHRCFVALLQDRLDVLKAIEPELFRRIEVVTPPLTVALQALFEARAGRLSEARVTLRRAAGDELAHLQALTVLSVLAETSAHCGDLEVGRKTWEVLQPHADSNVTLGFFGLVSGPPVRGVLGMLGSLLSHPDAEVRANFDAALERTAAMGAQAHEVWVRLWFGQHLARRGEGAAAAEQLRASAALAAKLGMGAVAARAERALSETGGSKAAPEPTATPSAPSPFALEAHEGGWRLERAGKTFVLKGLRGMAMLARLLAAPGVEVHSLELVSGDADEALPDAGDAGELLDEKAKAAYRKRIEALTEQIEDAEERGDAMRAERSRAELEALSKELSRAVGLGGRSRRAASSAERARVTAQRRLREAIKKIAELDPETGELLERTIRTGTFCAYEPNRKARK
ncbi:MAG: AAA family ATPase [Myxococcaceae bacterium]